MSLVDKYIRQSIAHLEQKPQPKQHQKCRRCGNTLIDMVTGQRDHKAEIFHKCRDCLNGKKKLCECGTWHKLKSIDCFDCFMKKRKEKNSEPTE